MSGQVDFVAGLDLRYAIELCLDVFLFKSETNAGRGRPILGRVGNEDLVSHQTEAILETCRGGVNVRTISAR